MITKILLGTNAAAVAVAGALYFMNGNLRDEVSLLQFEKSTLKASLATQRELAAAAEEAAAVLRVQREEAEARAKRADEIREAILENDDETLATVDGPLGAALGVLREARCSCDQGSAGQPPD